MPLLILDFDGTLIDVRRRNYRAYADALLRVGGTPLTEEAYWRRRQDGEATNSLVDGMSGRARGRFVEQWHELIESPYYLRLDRTVPGARRALEGLAGSYELVLITMRRDRPALFDQIQRMSLSEYFSDVICQADSFETSTKTDLIRQRLGPRAGAGAPIVGDAEGEIEAAKALGLRSISVTTGVRSPQFLQQAGASEIIGSVAELPAVLAAGEAARYPANV